MWLFVIFWQQKCSIHLFETGFHCAESLIHDGNGSKFTVKKLEIATNQRTI